ncbi:MAG TPA: Lrp/AsnC family transcriptional regulator [Candidatus Eisenbacteria bacterium]|nr:Lrp/AsnC family transcriptional regulator [Candidatus Eisenbacteria bacterium]
MLDALDRSILALLQENARTPNSDIARRVGLAPSAVLERIRKLERTGVIRGYEPRIDPHALGAGLVAFIFVHAEEPIGGLDTGRQIARLPEVQEVHQVAGEDCYLVKVRVADTEALGALLRDGLGALKTIRSTRTTIVLTSVKEHAPIPTGAPFDRKERSAPRKRKP